MPDLETIASAPTDGAAHLRRHAVRDLGGDRQPMLMVHGYGCNQAMWHLMLPYFRDDYRVVLMDHVGTGNAGMEDWSPEAYRSLHRYAADVIGVVEALDLREVILVGHSVSAIICGLVAAAIPKRVARLVMIGPSPYYLNEGDYRGGFEASDIRELIAAVESNYIGWSKAMAPAIMGRPDAPDTGEYLTARFCEQDPEVALAFARATFESDHRPDLPKVPVPTLVLQCSQDIIAGEQVGRFVAEAIPEASYRKLAARGHCPNYSAPEETSAAIAAWLAE